MKDELAEKLLVTVLDWKETQSKVELPYLQDIAQYKYDEYQQFAPGRRFVESLARWLNQFDPEDREAAYELVRNKLIFCSSTEIVHLVGMAWHDRIRPHLIHSVAKDKNINPRHIARIVRSKEFQMRQRQCLFLGLSDGARIDMFRRTNSFDLSHEQISQTHELSIDRVGSLLEELRSDLGKITDDTSHKIAKFRTIVLLDDFSASGRSYYMPKDDDKFGGKIARFHRAISDSEGPLSRLVELEETEVFIVFYVATDQARQHLEKYSERVWQDSVASVEVEVVQTLPKGIALRPENCGQLKGVISKYYDHSIHDEHLQKGETVDSRYGFAACGLPLVMHHNTPNNSIALLWSYEDTDAPGLFPRVRRHRSTK